MTDVRVDQLVPREPPPARTLRQRFDPDTGTPMRLGRVWPPRLMLHNIATKGGGDTVEVRTQLWVMHVLQAEAEVWIRPSDEPAVDSEGRTISGLEVGVGRLVVPTSRAPGLGQGLLMEPEWRPVPVTVRWSSRFAQDIQTVEWVRKGLFIELTDGRHRRVFQAYLYLTPHEAELPGQTSRFDDHPHYCWVDDGDVPLVVPGVARSWVELPSPMGSPRLAPACWVQPPSPDGRPGAAHVRGGPADVTLVPVYPVEPAIAPGVEAVGWNGALGGHDPRPPVQALAVDSDHQAGQWSTRLEYWDTPLQGAPCGTQHLRPTVLEEPTPCVWPVVDARDGPNIVLYDLVGAPDAACEVTVNVRVGLPPDAESVRLEGATIRLGDDVVGHWRGGPIDIHAGQTVNLRCAIDLGLLTDAADGRLKLTVAFEGRPLRGIVPRSQIFRTENGPFARLVRTRSTEPQREDRGRSGVRSPWLCIDLGTEGTCASVSFMDGFVPRVIQVPFDEGPVYPSKVYLSPALGGVYGLTDEPADDALYTTMIKLGLRFGDGAHPGCPDHIAATEVARFFLKRFLLEVRERMAWFPLDEADVLVSFPPRLSAMPRFVRSLHETFASVLQEVVWAPDVPRSLVFREEAFLVSVPCLYRDLQISPLRPGASRYYWVMDFGGGTTDVCGFLCTADEHGEEHVVERMTYPQRLPHHLSGNDVTRAFYRVLYQELVGAGVVAGPSDADVKGRRFAFPPDPFPTARATAAALLNQTALRELADALKCLSREQWNFTTLRTLARTLPRARLKTVEGVSTTLVGLLGNEGKGLGESTAAELHAKALDPSVHASRHDDPAHPIATTALTCSECGTENPLPRWVFASNRSFRFRCRACGVSQRGRLAADPFPATVGDEGAPVITGYRDATVKPAKDDAEPTELYLDQDGRTYVVKDMTTLRRWVEERRVGGDDLLSEGGVGWVPLKERPELSDLFRSAEVLSVDITQEVPRHHYKDMVYPEPTAVPMDEDLPMLGRDIRLFLSACREALEEAVGELGIPEEDLDVVVLVAGRASLYPPIADGVTTFLPGRVVHLTNAWVKRTFAHAGPIDPAADLKTMTVNGGGLFALLHTNPETSHLALSFETLQMDCPVYLQSVAASRPWLLTHRLDLRPGYAMELVEAPRPDLFSTEEEITQAGEPPARPLPPRTPITGDLRLVVDGLPEDRGWEPYVAIAQGTAKRRRGRRARTLRDTRLVAHERSFELGPLTDEQTVVFHRMLPELPLLGGASTARGPFEAPNRSPFDPVTDLSEDGAFEHTSDATTDVVGHDPMDPVEPARARTVGHRPANPVAGGEVAIGDSDAQELG